MLLEEQDPLGQRPSYSVHSPSFPLITGVMPQFPEPEAQGTEGGIEETAPPTGRSDAAKTIAKKAIMWLREFGTVWLFY
jgi:hypothetical protein